MMVLWATPVARCESVIESLRKESAAALASAARAAGNPIEGAILYANQTLACTSCHAASATDSLGPDLTSMTNEVTDAYLIQSLLDPSASIRQGFEQRRILTADGTVYAGRVIEENEQRIVLRIASEPQKRIAIPLEDVESNQVVEKSAMPDNLVDQLKNRQQFLDLLRYLMQLRDLGGEPKQAATSNPRSTLPTALLGQVLVERYQCVLCHQEMRRDVGFPVRLAPDLTWSGGRISPEFIQRYLCDPTAAHPGTTMPAMLESVDAAQRDTIAKELTHYILSLGGNPYETQEIDPEASHRGRTLYESVGCLACHSPQNDDGTEHSLSDSISLAHVVEKYNLDGLTSFLEDPHAVRPASGMPNMSLSHWEAIDLASYLLRHAETTRTTPIRIEGRLVENGRRHFERFSCAHCHAGAPADPVISPADVNLDSGTGCLSGVPGPWPAYRLSSAERSAIRAAIESPRIEFTDQQKLSVTLARFQCVHCHERDGWGGVSDDRDPFFQTANPNLGPQGRIPPRLTHVGAKLQPKWLREVLVSGRSIRPYMQTRMPQFGTQNVAHLVELFQNLDQLPPIDPPEFNDLKAMRTAGHELVSDTGLNCIACHTFQLKPSETMSAVDLTEMSERLHYDWFVHYMLDPQSLSPQTVMPAFWPGGRAVRTEILEGDTPLQLEALWQYLLDGRQAREPKGLRRESIELLAGKEAVMLRRSWPDVGKRGIGVGYPGQVNLVFDAEQLRLANLWRGRFADPSGVWRSQGHGVARPLEREPFSFTSGPDLDDSQNPWIPDEGRPPNHQFQGYDLDHLRRPAFRYRFEEIDVTDYLVDETDADSGQCYLRRRMTFNASHSRKRLSLRIASGEMIEQIAPATYRVANRLQVYVEGDWEATIVAKPETKELRIALDIPEGESQVAVQYQWIGSQP